MRNVNILSEIEFNNNKYILYTNKEELVNVDLLYAKVIDNQIHNDLSDNELSFLKEITKYIFLSDKKNHIKVNSFNFNNELYTKYYDNITDIYYVSGKDKKVVDYLNYVFNNIELSDTVDFNSNSIPSDDASDYANKKIKKRIKIFDIGIVVFTISMSLIAAQHCEKFLSNSNQNIFGYSTNNIYIKIDNSIEDYEEKVSLNNLDKDLETMIVAIKQNKKITDFERDVFLSNINFYIENINYIDVNEISNRLKKLEIESNNNRKKYNVNNNVLAIYSKPENKIVNFHTDDTKTLPKDILTHEFMHIHSSKIYKFGLSLMEALTEIMQHEYFYKYDETTGPYKEHCMYVRVLCEIIGAEPLKKFFFSGNINYIYKELLKLDNDYDRITNLIDNMDSLLAAINNYDIDMTNDKKDILRQVMDSSRENIENDLKHYFKLARGYNVEDDKVISTYFNVVADNYYPVYYNDEEIYTYDFIYKGYFSEQYIKANPSLILHVSSYNYETDSIVNDSITIKDEDRIQNSKAYH